MEALAMIARLVVLALTLALTACGGGGGDSATVHIVAYGDSTMVGLLGPGNRFSALVAEQFGGRVAVTNEAVSGTTIKMLMTGTDKKHTAAFPDLMRSSNADIVISNFGINDPADSTAAEFMANVAAFVESVRAVGKVPVLLEPNPVCENPAAPKNIEQIEQQVRAVESYVLTNGVMLVRQYDYIQGLAGWQGLLVDCIHPGESLNAIEGQRLFDALQPSISAAMQQFAD